MSKNKYDIKLNTAEMNDSHMGLVSRIQPQQRILELGCATGYLSEYLKKSLNCYIVGVDIDTDAIQQAAHFCDKAIVADLDNESWLAEIEGEQFDVVLCADVLEHLKSPINLLAGLKPFLHSKSRLLASVPNIAHASIRLELLQGHFDYESIGLLDNTHLHFYTRNGLISMLMQAGYLCCDIAYSVHDLADEAIDQHLAKAGLIGSKMARELLHTADAIAYQFIIEATPAKTELVQHLPPPLTPKPLISSGLFYSEKQERIEILEKKNEHLEFQYNAEREHTKNHQKNNYRLEEKISTLEQQIEAEREHNKNHQKNSHRLEEKIATLEQQIEAEREHTKNHQKNSHRLEEKIATLEQQIEAEREHTKNHQKNNHHLEQKISLIEQQRDGEKEHNKNYRQAIEEWQATTLALDNSLFNLTEQLKLEQKKNNDLSITLSYLKEQIIHFRDHSEHLENVLQRVHKKISYRLVRWVKDTPHKITQLIQDQTSIEADIPHEHQPATVNVHDYNAWLDTYQHLTEQALDAFKADLSHWQNPPMIAVLMPVYNPNKSCLINAIESVLQQIYLNFELCIADDASTHPYVREVLEEYAQKDSRIKVIFREHNGHISAASNSALTLVTADYIALMDHDDLLTPDALYRVAKTIQQQPDVELIYSDEDKMDLQGNRYAPYFKPDWNPELFLSHNFICHLGVYKTEKVRALKGFDTAFDGAQDYDLALRYLETIEADKIVHIPHILYHWRAVAGSTANGVHEKPYAQAQIINAVSAALQRRKRPAKVIEHEHLPGALQVRYFLPKSLPLVSIIIPTRNGFDLLRRCVESLFAKTNYPNYELLIIDNGSDDFVALRYLHHLQENKHVTIIHDPSPFNFSALNNKAVKQAKGKIIALLNNDLEVIDPDWLDEMVSHAVHPEVGAVGAKLYYPDDTIQHAGVIVGLGGVAGHSHKHSPRDNPGFCGRLLLTQNLSAVTAACLVVRKEILDAVGGFNEQDLSIAFNDVDLCLRIQAQGFYNVWTPYAQLYHYESASRGYENTPEKQARFNNEVAYMKASWGQQLLIDPAYNPNLTLDREDFSFSWPPRN